MEKSELYVKKTSEKLNSFFEIQLNSTDLNIYHVENLKYETENSIIDPDFIDCKMFLMPFRLSIMSELNI